jgi:hypothetical protein
MNIAFHIFFALLLGILLINFFHVPLYYFIFLIIGASFPDIDLSNSFIRKVLNLIAVLIAVYLLITTFNWINSLLFLGVWFLLTWIIPRHRGIVHSYLSAVILSALVWILFGVEAGLMFFVGYVSHLVADGIFFKIL